MDFGISASLFESAGVSIEEMLLLGKPVVVTESGGCSSLVDDENAFVVKKGSVDQLVQGIEEMASHYTDFDNDMIRKKAIEKYDMRNIVRQHIAVYKTVIQSSQNTNDKAHQ